AKPDANAFKELISDEEKGRSDAKLNNRVIASRLAQYALYGANNPSTWVLSATELKALGSNDLIQIIKGLSGKKHSINYFGQRPILALVESISKLHQSKQQNIYSDFLQEFLPRSTTEKEVFFVNYDMVQASIYWLSKGPMYNSKDEPIISTFNQYFGGDMSSVVFQNIRESKALAYSTYADYSSPAYANKPYTTIAFIGTQADKFHEAIAGMNELLTDLPVDENVFALSKESLKNRIETERVDDENLVGYWFSLADLGETTDSRELLYKQLPTIGMQDVAAFHKTRIAGNIYTYAVLANAEKITAKDLEKYGKVKVLTLEDVFGY
ncbi:MAG: insulinase family protein, partial [Bacteroidia bacterium]|nr:insulinase family protein [Bacteroidia bacterium]